MRIIHYGSIETTDDIIAYCISCDNSINFLKWMDVKLQLAELEYEK